MSGFPYAMSPQGNRVQRPPANFFVVWTGRKTGVFHKWSLVHALVTGFPDHKYKGFSNLADAEAAFLAGPN